MIHQNLGIGHPPKKNNMKRILFTVLTFLFVSIAMYAQHINLGIKGGLNGYTIKGDNSADLDIKVGYNIGLLGHIHIKKQFALQPEIVYSVQGAKSKISGSDQSLTMNYINVPVNFQYMYDNGFRLQAGPQFGILTSAKAATGSVKNDVKSSYKSTDIGLTVGMSYVQPSTGFGIDIRYNHGLTNINQINSVKSYNRGVQVGVFYLFDHKS